LKLKVVDIIKQWTRISTEVRETGVMCLTWHACNAMPPSGSQCCTLLRVSFCLSSIDYSFFSYDAKQSPVKAASRLSPLQHAMPHWQCMAMAIAIMTITATTAG
jgi:hypothetical protein